VKLIERRAAADAALIEARHREHRWLQGTHTLRTWSKRHRAGLIFGGGLAAGFATPALPIAALLRLASALAGTASLMLEGPFLRMIAAAHRAGATPPSASTPTSAS
jgi:hypothetical protein